MMSPKKVQELKEILFSTFQNKVYYNEQDNTVYYQTGVDLNHVMDVTAGFKVYVQLILF
jgi:hypothetical protein